MRFSKYGNTKTTRAGRSFASKLEAALFDLLILREKAGELKDVRQQVSVYLTDARIQMIPDYSAVNVETGETEYHESKGAESDVYRIKRRLWKYYGPGKLYVYKGSYRKVYLHEVIIPKKPNA